VLETAVSSLQSEVKLLTDAMEQVIPSFRLAAGAFKSADDSSVFNIAVLGQPGDSERRRARISWAEKDERGVSIKFLSVASGCSLSPKMDAVLECDFDEWIQCSCARLRIAFAGGTVPSSHLTVDLRTGTGVGRWLAAAVGKAKGTKKVTFGRELSTLAVTGDAKWGVWN
jgi:hypothetical protein